MYDGEYFYNKGVDTLYLYNAIKEADEVNLDQLKEISTNFVLADQPLLKQKRDIQIRYNGLVRYEKDEKTLYSLAAGFVHYTKLGVNVYSFLFNSKDRTKGYVIIPISSDTQNSVLDSEILEKEMKLFGIKILYNTQAFNKAMSSYNSNVGGRHLIVEGLGVVHQRPMVVKMVYDLNKNKLGILEKKTGKMNYKEKNYVRNVKKGELIATYELPQKGINGRTIFGEIIKPKSEKINTYTLGKGLEIDEEEKKVYAEIQGILDINRLQKLSVLSEQTISSDVNISTGNIDSESNVWIKGNVTKGFSVKSKGTIKINGNVEEANIESQRDIFIRGGVMGGDNSFIKAEGSVHIGYANNFKIQCEGDLIIKTYLMNCHASVSGMIIVENLQKGKIIGGVLEAYKGIQSAIVGNVNAIKTVLSVGYNPRVVAKIIGYEASLKENNNHIFKYKSNIGEGYFKNPKAFLLKVASNPQKIQAIKENLIKLKEYLQQRKEIESEIRYLRHTIEKGSHQARIAVFQQAFEGVVINIRNATKTLSKNINTPTCYIYDPSIDGINVAPIQEHHEATDKQVSY